MFVGVGVAPRADLVVGAEEESSAGARACGSAWEYRGAFYAGEAVSGGEFGDEALLPVADAAAELSDEGLTGGAGAGVSSLIRAICAHALARSPGPAVAATLACGFQGSVPGGELCATDALSTGNRKLCGTGAGHELGAPDEAFEADAGAGVGKPAGQLDD